MLARTSLSLLSLAVLAVATPWGDPTTTTVTVTETSTAPGSKSTEPASSCSTGPIQCCNSVQKASDPGLSGILGLLGIVVQDLTTDVGLTCSPITVIGAGEGECSANAVCCQDNSHGSLISIGCVPVIL
ncbi:fungal hydrophobin [Polyporus arcularius HHB13444]|uniref:Hydrophobin n=1 Tax=Polyporus arcularius HHB13444 TaxID=1314778 RepID=A0A5C3PDK9_9APHY|nr:fungal hydrophobin [Polyporus arcularius HHB13444]